MSNIEVCLPLPTPPLSKGFDHNDEPLDLSTAEKIALSQDNGSFISSRRRDYASRLERRLGDTEASYFLPSRESGVNDMYLHLGFRAPAHLMERTRVSLVWAIMRLRHPLLASKVEMHDYEDIRFVYYVHSSGADALRDANFNLEYRTERKDDLIDSYLNGPRTLSNDRLSYLIVSQSDFDDILLSPPPSPSVELESIDLHEDGSTSNYDILICATHFLGDGMALHQFANDFFGILGSSQNNAELVGTLEQEWETRWQNDDQLNASVDLPSALENRLPPAPSGNFHRLASRVDHQKSQQKLIGGHSFPRRPGQPRRTVVPTVPIDEKHTKEMLKSCKAHGVSISAALFAICNIAWAKTSGQKWDMPIMMYSALNIRPHLSPSKLVSDSYWFLAIGYFNIVLPTFLPKSGDLAQTFWHRARLAKNQSAQAAKNPMVVSRIREMARERGVRARAWAKEDDEKELGTWTAPPPQTKTGPPKTPSAALLGLSLLGNLDGIYKHAKFDQIKMHTLTTGSRQRSGGMLLFGYTFVGKLWISLGYDENGFDADVVQRFWSNVLGSIDELLTT